MWIGREPALPGGVRGPVVTADGVVVLRPAGRWRGTPVDAPVAGRAAVRVRRRDGSVCALVRVRPRDPDRAPQLVRAVTDAVRRRLRESCGVDDVAVRVRVAGPGGFSPPAGAGTARRRGGRAPVGATRVRV